MSQGPPTRERVVDPPAGPATAPAGGRVSAARLEVEAAYAAARDLVYDRLPTGPVDPHALDRGQQDAIARLDAAEEELRQARLASHAGSSGLQIKPD